jgi:phosphotransferase system  glucose/maltose/N-acetylglucosamine-specific IIC component
MVTLCMFPIVFFLFFFLYNKINEEKQNKEKKKWKHAEYDHMQKTSEADSFRK